MKDEVIKDINLKISDLEWHIKKDEELLPELQKNIDDKQASIIINKEKIKKLINIKNHMENLT
jgi:hypothetical protein